MAWLVYTYMNIHCIYLHTQVGLISSVTYISNYQQDIAARAWITFSEKLSELHIMTLQISREWRAENICFSKELWMGKISVSTVIMISIKKTVLMKNVLKKCVYLKIKAPLNPTTKIPIKEKHWIIYNQIGQIINSVSIIFYSMLDKPCILI